MQLLIMLTSAMVVAKFFVGPADDRCAALKAFFCSTHSELFNVKDTNADFELPIFTNANYRM